ncbi:MAG: ABC transporter permease [Actinomycetota bacterium]|nr:ABC transporter permease [Actinomycetota bacterium]
MSPGDVAPGDVAPGPRRGATRRLLRSELRLVFGRRRNQILLLALGLVPLLIGIAVKVSRGGGRGPDFINQVSSNGLFLVFTAVAVSLPLFLPLAVGIISGDTIAGEASAGTLRYLLVVPVSRSKLLAAKAFGSMTFVAAAVLTISTVGLITGAALFGLGDVTLLSGDTVGIGNGLLRALGVDAYATLSLTGLVATGLFISTLTEVPVAAMAATIVVAATSAILDALPQLSAIHPYLLTDHWLDFGEFLRSQIDVSTLQSGLLVQLGWTAIAASLAWARFTTADITA